MRLLLPSLVVAVLVGASALAVAHGVADENVAHVNGRLYELGRDNARTGTTTDPETKAELVRLAKQAVSLAPGNSQYWDALSRTLRAQDADSAAVYAASQRAVLNHPSSAYAWSGLVQVADRLNAEGRLPGGKAGLEQAIQRAAALGRFEPQVLAVVVDKGLVNWPIVGAETRAATTMAVANLARLYPDTVLAIAANRGQLALICTDKRLVTQPTCTISST